MDIYILCSAVSCSSVFVHTFRRNLFHTHHASKLLLSIFFVL
jgi:hypothetical protein